MKDSKRFVAVDLGAESGRVMLATLVHGKVELRELHRFASEPVHLRGTLCWDLPRIVLEVECGLARAAAECEGRVDGIAVDSWGVDYGLVDESGALCGLPVHYRDARTEGAIEEFTQQVSRADIFAETGLQFLAINTLFQLHVQKRDRPHSFPPGARILLIAHLVSFLLCGRVACETTLASTSQLLGPRDGRWSRRLIEALGLPLDLFPEVVEPGTVLAPLASDVVARTGFREPPPVIACGAHDTASAVAAVPAEPEIPWAFLSSGTWSLLGVELPGPALGPDVLAANFTNELGVCGTVRLLKNIIGLWTVQECRRRWEAEDGAEIDYATLSGLAEEAGEAVAIVDPSHPDLFAPADMPATIQRLARESGQPEPNSRGEIVRCALESLALSYRRTLESVERLTGRRIEVLHVVGGGSQSDLLNRLTADAIGLPVIAGPVEATAIGNVLVQAMATGSLASLEEVRAVVRASTPTREYQPEDPEALAAKYDRFLGLG